MKPGFGYRGLSRLDATFNRIYGSRWNPLYHSGAITIALLGVLLVTGIYLLIFYRLGTPYESVARLNEQVWTGRWIRALHRFASDAALVAAAVHGVKMYVQRRTWGPRTLAWVSGIVLFGAIFVSGWTGYVLVWDTHAQVLAVEGARLMDALPIFSEPISRSFTGERELPSAFFFVNLFAHIALPLSLGVLLWVHLARVARPVLLPARAVLWGSCVALLTISVLWPLSMAPPADLLRIPSSIPTDWFFGFWLPVSQRLPAGIVLLTSLALTVGLIAVPWLTRPAKVEIPGPAVVNERTCTGCEQCVHDCPYDAIEMVARSDGREGAVALVKTDLCTSCGICIGSCPPMAIGVLEGTGRDQLDRVRSFLATEKPSESDVVIVGCDWSAARTEAERFGAKLFPVSCVGTLHSSTIEFLLRGGAGGVMVVGCPEHDGRTREGVTWTQERMFEGRKADLKERVDRNRVRLVQVSIGEKVELHRAVVAFSEEIVALREAGADDASPDLLTLCRAREELETIPEGS